MPPEPCSVCGRPLSWIERLGIGAWECPSCPGKSTGMVRAAVALGQRLAAVRGWDKVQP